MDEGQTDPSRSGPEPRITETDEQAEARMMRALSMMSGGSQPNSRPVRTGGMPGGAAPRPTQGGSVAAAGQRGPAGRRTMPQASAGQTRRHRFVQDGEVPVVSVARQRRDGLPTSPVPAARSAEIGRPQTDELGVERAARLEAERRLAETAVQLRSHQTRLGDAELARNAAEAELRDVRLTIQTLHAELALAQSSGRRSPASASEHRSHPSASEHPAPASALEHRAPASVTEPEHRPTAYAPERDASAAVEDPAAPIDARDAGTETPSEPIRRRSRARPNEIDGEEPEPVKWWA